MMFLNYLVSGVSLGSVYAIIALGYTMVYGIAKMLNFAHGDVIMIGAYTAFFATLSHGMPAPVAVAAAMLLCMVLGMTIEFLAYRPLRNASSLAVLITAIGVSYFLQNVALIRWGSNPKVFPSMVLVPSVSLFGGPVRISGGAITTMCTCVVVMVALTLFIRKAKMGKAMRAVSEDRAAAQLMGINVNRTISVTFAIGSALAAVAGILLCSMYPALVPTTGSMPGIKAFTAAVFGGIGSIPGAMLGAFIIVIFEILLQGLYWTTFPDAFTFALLIVVLCVKPTGLFGEKVTDKV